MKSYQQAREEFREQVYVQWIEDTAPYFEGDLPMYGIRFELRAFLHYVLLLVEAYLVR